MYVPNILPSKTYNNEFVLCLDRLWLNSPSSNWSWHWRPCPRDKIQVWSPWWAWENPSNTTPGAVHKWRHPLRGEGVSAKSWRHSMSLFSKMGDKGEGEVKNLKKWMTLFMDGPKWMLLQPAHSFLRRRLDKGKKIMLIFLRTHLLNNKNWWWQAEKTDRKTVEMFTRSEHAAAARPSTYELRPA